MSVSERCQLWDLMLLFGILGIPALDLFCWSNEQAVEWGQGWFASGFDFEALLGSVLRTQPLWRRLGSLGSPAAANTLGHLHSRAGLFHELVSEGLNLFHPCVSRSLWGSWAELQVLSPRGSWGNLGQLLGIIPSQYPI